MLYASLFTILHCILKSKSFQRNTRKQYFSISKTGRKSYAFILRWKINFPHAKRHYTFDTSSQFHTQKGHARMCVYYYYYTLFHPLSIVAQCLSYRANIFNADEFRSDDFDVFDTRSHWLLINMWILTFWIGSKRCYTCIYISLSSTFPNETKSTRKNQWYEKILLMGDSYIAKQCDCLCMVCYYYGVCAVRPVWSKHWRLFLDKGKHNKYTNHTYKPLPLKVFLYWVDSHKLLVYTAQTRIHMYAIIDILLLGNGHNEFFFGKGWLSWWTN